MNASIDVRAEATDKISRSTRFYYGFGSVAYGVKDNGFVYFLLFYYNQVLGLPGHLASTAILVALVFDAISDPIVGNISDRLHSKWGRRHPFMYAAAFPVAFSFYGLWNPPELSEDGLFYFLMFNALLVRTFITFYEVPSTALAPELTPNYDERTKLAATRHFFGWVGGITIAVVMYGLLMVKTPGGLSGSLSIYFGTYFWGFTPGQLGVLVPTGLISATFALSFAPYVSHRYGKKRGAIGLSLFAASFAPAPYLARLAGLTPASGSTELLMLLIVYNVIEIGLIISSTTLVSAMIADVVEESELVTGRRSEGIFFAARSFISKSVSGLGIMLGTLLLSAVEFPQDAKPGEVDPQIIENLGYGYVPMIIVLYLSAIVCLVAYNITRERHLKNVEVLAARRSAS